MVRVPENVARIACLHVIHSAVPTTANQILVQVVGSVCGQYTTKPLQYTCGTFYSNMAEEYLESLLLKSGRLQLESM